MSVTSPSGGIPSANSRPISICMALTSAGAMATRRPASLRLLLFVLLLSPALAATTSEEPATPECRRFANGDLSFCSMVDYAAVVDAEDRDGAAADARAKFFYDNVHVLLLRFGCHNKYSLYGCDDCRDAYKHWVCGIKFQKCGASDADALASQLCPLSPSADDSADCVEGISGRHRTCLSLCEDVVRKCPYVLNFQCPTSETIFFSTDISTCNKLDRSKNPDNPSKPWPGTFADV